MANSKTFKPYDPLQIPVKVEVPQFFMDALEKLKFPYKNLKT